jgi:hypothetical protein
MIHVLFVFILAFVTTSYAFTGGLRSSLRRSELKMELPIDEFDNFARDHSVLKR